MTEQPKRIFNKVFEVGMPKTGTTSLGMAFRQLGLETLGWSPEVHYDFTKQGNPEPALQLAQDYDAFEDGPWHNLPVELLDMRFPGSKFILLEREGENWYESMCAQFQGEEYDWFHHHGRAEWIARMQKKYQRIRNYFSSRPDDLLMMNIVDQGDGWEKLCPFLGLSVPETSFPWVNHRQC
jgi:hypothetical protein